jgi:N-sulfoglucosamine sulfohydrolase
LARADESNLMADRRGNEDAGRRPPRLGRAGVLALALAVVGLAACSHPNPQGVIEPRPAGETRPNILVIEVDHLGLELGAYGDAAAQTPAIDRLAREGVVFTDAYAASGSEDAETAALLTGMHPSTIAVVQEWTGQAQWTVTPPPEIKGYPELLRAAGYDTFHVGPRPDPFGSPASLWAHDATKPGEAWIGGRLRQPFVGVVDLSTVGAPAGPAPAGISIDARRIVVPGYLPNTPAVRDALKAEYERVRRVDAAVAAILARLEQAHVLDHTIVVFTAKSGPVRPRAERTVYDAGAHTPLIVRWPDGQGRGSVRHDLISGIDLAPAILRMGGVAPRAWMQGQDHISTAATPNQAVFTVQNRVDSVYERVFALRDGRYLYVLNLAPYTPVLGLARPGPLAEAVTDARRTRRLSPDQAQMYSDERGQSELYDVKADPLELHNLAADPAHAGEVARLSQTLNAFAGSALDYSTWTARDLGDLFKPEGVTPTTAAPEILRQRGLFVLSSVTPGASILWRVGEAGPWTLYTGPFAARSKAGGGGGKLQAKAIRYGFKASVAVEVDL